MSSNSSNLSRKQRVIRAIAFPVWVFVSFFLVQIVLSLVLLGLEKLGVPFANTNQNILNTIFALLVYGLTILVVIGVPKLAKRVGSNREELGLMRLPVWSDLLLAPAGFLVYAFISGLLVSAASHFIPGFDTGQVQDTGFSAINTHLELILAFFTLVVLAPVAEETLFRGYLFGKLKHSVPVWAAALITSVLFGLVHVAFSAQPDWPLALDTFVLSLMLCTLRQVSGSLWASMLLHMIKNGVAFYILFLSPIISHTMGG
jgi:membrane protease YdiL (CAAX protease family)